MAAFLLSSLSTLSAIASRIYLDQLMETEAIRLLSLSSTLTVTVPISLPGDITSITPFRHYLGISENAMNVLEQTEVDVSFLSYRAASSNEEFVMGVSNGQRSKHLAE